MSGTEPPALDLSTPAGARSAARLAALRSPGLTGSAAGAAPLPATPLLPETSPVSAVPEAVWEDARRQLAGMLEGLERLQRDAPALGQPADGASGTSSVSAAGAGQGQAEQEVPRQEAPQHDGGDRR